MRDQVGGTLFTRLESVRSKLPDWGVEAILISNKNNRRWLSGFTGSAGMLLISADIAMLGTDSRYWEQAEEQAPAFDLFKLRGSMDAALVSFITQAGVETIGFEADHVTVDRYEKFTGLKDISWIGTKETLVDFRQLKDKHEIGAIHEAAKITDKAMSMVNTLARPGVSEKELAWQLEKMMREDGATGLAFPVIVASGSNSARPHHEPGDRKLAKGDTIIVDMGAELNGYCSDMTRTFYLGADSSEQFNQIYNIVLEAQQNALKYMRAGMTGQEIDSFSRSVINTAGYGENIGHGLGHGLGIEVHEMPRLSPLVDKETIEAGVVVTVEPGIYISGWGGVRIEDLVQVTDDGINILSACPKIPNIPV